LLPDLNDRVLADGASGDSPEVSVRQLGHSG
jgi:hypothetical protein